MAAWRHGGMAATSVCPTPACCTRQVFASRRPEGRYWTNLAGGNAANAAVLTDQWGNYGAADFVAAFPGDVSFMSTANLTGIEVIDGAGIAVGNLSLLGGSGTFWDRNGVVEAAPRTAVP